MNYSQDCIEYLLRKHGKAVDGGASVTSSTSSTSTTPTNLQKGDIIGFVGDSYVVGFSTVLNKDYKNGYKGYVLKTKAQNGQGSAIDEKGCYCRSSCRTSGASIGVESAINDKCKIIVIYLGINDISAETPNKSQIISNLISLVENIQKNDIRAFVCIPLKTFCSESVSVGYYYVGVNNHILVDCINQVQLKTGCQVINLSEGTDLEEKMKGWTKKDIHPGPGYPEIVKTILEKMNL